jgi:hypothetical protein
MILNILTEEDKKVQKDYDEFWKDIVEKDGCVDLWLVKKELSDFRFIINQLPKIYMHITNGRLSKHMYTAETIIGIHDDIRTEEIEEAIKETEQNTAKEIFDEIRHSLSCYSKIIYTEYGTTNENIVYQAINEFDLEQLREKYNKGVE